MKAHKEHGDHKENDVRILIILKRRQDYNGERHSYIGLSTGLYNSAKYIEEMLLSNDINTKLVVVPDNNSIDKEVSIFKPTHVIIEALWVVPEKFKILSKLHPHVKWIIRLHSQIPFISSEGIAMKWIGEYIENPNIIIGANSPEMICEIREYLKLKMNWKNNEEEERIIYLPNYYPKVYKIKHEYKTDDIINISCFGAIRPLKNQLIQAFAAIKFAEKIGKKLHFHINGNRIEQKGEPILHNLIGLFDNLSDKGHKLILHDWLIKEEFLELCSKMDIGLQCSFSETFNIVGADIISQGVPLVGSSEIPWLNPTSIADATKSKDITTKLLNAYNTPIRFVKLNQRGLNCYTTKSNDVWLSYFLKKKDTSIFTVQKIFKIYIGK